MTLNDLLSIDELGGLSRIAKLYDESGRVVAEYKTIQNPVIGVTECLKRSYLYEDDKSGEQAKLAIWTQDLENLVSPDITNITISNSSIQPGLPSGTKIADIVVEGGVVPIVITISSNPGNLFRIDNETDLVLNAPSESGEYPITIQATDDDGKIESQNFILTVNSFSNINSILLDGVDEYIDYGTNPDIRFERTNSFSISFWLKMGIVSGTARIIGNIKPTVSPNGWCIFTGLSTNKNIVFQLSNSTTNRLIVNTTNNFTENRWYHFTITYDGSSSPAGVKIYADGVLQSTTTFANTLTLTTVNTNNLRSGASSDAAPAHFYNGNIDELAIWNKELNQSEIDNIYNSGNPVDLLTHSANADLLHWYRMGDGDTFPTILDKKGLNNGTCVNMESLDIQMDAP